MEPSQSEASNARDFLIWIRVAAEEQRAEAAFTLAWAYRYVEGAQDRQGDLELCLATLLADPSPAVRLALARGIAGAPNPPRHVVVALAEDRPEIAATVLAQSPALSDVEIAHYALTGEECVQTAIARRADLSPSVATCLAEKAGPAALAALVLNKEASLPGAVLRRLAQRFADDRLLCAAMLARPDLPASVRCDLIEAVARFSAGVLVAAGLGPVRIERLIRTAVERRVISMASYHGTGEIRDLVRHLRAKGRLTIALLLRALTSGETAFFEIAAAELAGVDEAHAAALIREPQGAAFAALIRRAGFPAYCVALFRRALLLLDESGCARRGGVLRPVVSRLIDACATKAGPETGALVAALRRLEQEATLEEARALAGNFVSDRFEAPANEPRRERLEPARKTDRLENVREQRPAPLALAS